MAEDNARTGVEGAPETREVDPKDLMSLDEFYRKLDGGLTTVSELGGVTRDELEAVYSLAYDYYRTGRIDDAETLFKFLTTFDHLNEKYWMGMAAVLQVKKNFKRAAEAYALVSGVLNVSNVRAPYYAAECFLALGDRANALSALGHVKTYADVKTEEGRAYKAKAIRMEKLIGEDSGV